MPEVCVVCQTQVTSRLELYGPIGLTLCLSCWLGGGDVPESMWPDVGYGLVCEVDTEGRFVCRWPDESDKGS